MKVYNICDTKRFCKALSECKGKVELINSEGNALALFGGDGRENDCFLSLKYMTGTISQIELHFENPADAANMLRHLAHFNNAA